MYHLLLISEMSGDFIGFIRSNNSIINATIVGAALAVAGVHERHPIRVSLYQENARGTENASCKSHVIELS